MLQLITTVVILGATLIDGSGRAPIRNSAVVIKGDSIVAVGRRGQVKVPSDARVIDATAEGVGGLTQSLSRGLSVAVTGHAQHYGLIMAAGVLVAIAIAVFGW